MKDDLDSPCWWWSNSRFSRLLRLINAIESFLETQTAETASRINEEAEKIADVEDRQAFLQGVNDEIWDTESFQHIHREASLLAVIAAAENELNRICRRVATETDQVFEVTDLNGRGIVRAKEYLSKVGGARKAWNSNAWRDLRVAADIRNAFAHNDGISWNAPLMAYVESSPHLSRDGIGIKMEKTYAPFILSQLESLYKLLIKELGMELDAG